MDDVAEHELFRSPPADDELSLTQQLNNHSSDDRYKKKYLTLKLRCEQIQQDNERLANRKHYMRKLTNRLKKERRFLMNRLDQHGDEYENYQAVIPGEDEHLFNVLNDYWMQEATKSSVPINGTGEPQAELLASPSGGKKRRNEREKDPNAPKKPANAFLMFCQQQRNVSQEQFAKENPGQDVSHQELTKIMAHHWKNLNSEEKREYYDMYEKDKERYEKEMLKYTEGKCGINVSEAGKRAPRSGDSSRRTGLNGQQSNDSEDNEELYV
ncbi:PREDICTED: high mobility group protein 20A-like [Priapulus caudatus]|uniref:High mobility group protein 20A-like n=1 Tax=Priapulus caudatus TaxID=37621 RepID=A0ABM1E6E2_PRICU|nr:PREDICTED: high mobility group protein 20A-like [Priapulus caudatus]